MTTIAADNVAAAGATLHGNITPNELPTTGWFEWGTDANLTTFATTTVQSMGSGKTSVPINAVLTPLSPGTTYYFRVAAQNSVGPASKGAILSFNAVAQRRPLQPRRPRPSRSTAPILNGSVNPNGLATSAWFEWGTDPNLASHLDHHQLQEPWGPD